MTRPAWTTSCAASTTPRWRRCRRGPRATGTAPACGPAWRGAASQPSPGIRRRVPRGPVRAGDRRAFRNPPSAGPAQSNVRCSDHRRQLARPRRQHHARPGSRFLCLAGVADAIRWQWSNPCIVPTLARLHPAAYTGARPRAGQTRKPATPAPMGSAQQHPARRTHLAPARPLEQQPGRTRPPVRTRPALENMPPASAPTGPPRHATLGQDEPEQRQHAQALFHAMRRMDDAERKVLLANGTP